MDPFFLPLPISFPLATDVGQRDTIHKLEQYLDVALCLLRTTAERLRTALGADALEPALTRFLEGNDPVAQSVLISRFDSLVKQKKETEAVRLFRELFGVTWDQAFDLYAGWSYWDHGSKLRCLQATELRRLFASSIDSAREKPADGDHRESLANRCEST